MPGLPQMPPSAPRAMPSSRPSGGNFNSAPGGMAGGMPSGADTGAAFNQTTGFSEAQKIQRSVARGKKNAAVLSSVKLSRQQLEQWLAQFGLKLLTSSVELQMTHNFINSSYVIYPDGSNVSLTLFLKQTDQNIQSIAQQISQHLSGIASQLEVIDPYASAQNPFNAQFGVGAPPPIFTPQPNNFQNNYQSANQAYYPQNQYPQTQNPYQNTPNSNSFNPTYPNQNSYPNPNNNFNNQFSNPNNYPNFNNQN